jgi:hypothetical protein
MPHREPRGVGIFRAVSAFEIAAKVIAPSGIRPIAGRLLGSLLSRDIDHENRTHTRGTEVRATESLSPPPR